LVHNIEKKIIEILFKSKLNFFIKEFGHTLGCLKKALDE
jgi:hypothetical protein